MSLLNVRKQNKGGFTIIELMLVVTLIAILSGLTLSVLNVNELQKRPRDSQRVSGLGRIQTALELYFSDHRVYPVAAGWSKASASLLILQSSGYISVLPTYPNPPATGGSD